ncbi:MAG: phosphate ABC transporter permease subunit PstC [Spirochaetota bacterium]|nr:phosphate ABC transporter permease subunit PstC [Spirochaetota bacterium]
MSSKRILTDKIFEYLVTIIALTAVIAVILIFVFIVKEAFPIFFDNEIRYDGKGNEIATMSKMFLPQVIDGQLDFRWQPTSDIPKFGLLVLIVGSIKVTFISIIFAAPLAISAAIYSSQFAGRVFKEIIKPAIELLAGIPSVVLGFFALIVLANWVEKVLGVKPGLNTFTAGIALGIAVIPIIFTITEDSLSSVPKSYVEASLALGANKNQTIWRVLIPAVSPGIFAGVVLGFGRAIGETMIVLMASGNAGILSADFFDPAKTMPSTIAVEMGEIATGGTHYTVLFFIGFMLFTFTFILNYIGDFVVHRFKKKLAGLR